MPGANKLLSILGLFTSADPEWTVEEAAGALGIPASTAYRYFRALGAAGLIVKHSAGRYVLGPTIMKLDRQIRLLDPMIAAGRPIMVALKDQIERDCIIVLCRLVAQQVMCVHQEQIGNPAIGMTYERGLPLALHRGGASKVILAFLPARASRAYHRAHSKDIARVGLGKDWNAVKASLRRIRFERLSVTHGDVDRGVIGIAAPVFGPDGEIIGSLSMALPAEAGRSYVDAGAEIIKNAAARITDDMRRNSKRQRASSARKSA